MEVLFISLKKIHAGKIKPKSSKRCKWMDLKASWNIHATKKPFGIPTITKKVFLVILDVNNINIEIDIECLVLDMQTADAEANRLHMLLLDDPLLKGVVTGVPPTPSIKRSKSRTTVPTAPDVSGTASRPNSPESALERLHTMHSMRENLFRHQLDAFLSTVEEEEAEFGEIMRVEAEKNMREGFEAHAKKEEERLLRCAVRTQRIKEYLKKEHENNVERVAAIRKDYLDANMQRDQEHIEKSQSTRNASTSDGKTLATESVGPTSESSLVLDAKDASINPVQPDTDMRTLSCGESDVNNAGESDRIMAGRDEGGENSFAQCHASPDPEIYL
jgi:hypothetical protein